MNVLFHAHLHPKSHNLKWIFHLTQKHNIKSYVICTKREFQSINQEHVDFIESKGVKVLPPINFYSTKNIFRTYSDSRILKKYVKQYQIDYLHVMYAEPTALWGRWKNQLGCKVILTTRGTDILKTIPFFFKKKDLLSRIIQWEYKKAFRSISAITCTSKSQQDEVEKISDNRAIYLVRTGVDIETISNSNLDMKTKLGIKKDIILMPRSMQPLYNHEFTLEAISKMDPKKLESYAFVFVNADTKNQGYLKQLKEQASKINAEIHFCPNFNPEEIYSLYKQSDLVVMNPISDGTAVSAMETMAAGAPLIMPPLAYDKAVFADFIFQFKNWDAEELKDLMERVLEMPKEELKGKLEQAKTHIEDNFSINKQMEIMNSIYEKYK